MQNGPRPLREAQTTTYQLIQYRIQHTQRNSLRAFKRGFRIFLLYGRVARQVAIFSGSSIHSLWRTLPFFKISAVDISSSSLLACSTTWNWDARVVYLCICVPAIRVYICSWRLHNAALSSLFSISLHLFISSMIHYFTHAIATIVVCDEYMMNDLLWAFTGRQRG